MAKKSEPNTVESWLLVQKGLSHKNHTPIDKVQMPLTDFYQMKSQRGSVYTFESKGSKWVCIRGKNYRVIIQDWLGIIHVERAI
jgi:hypothetical protein